MLTLVAVVLAYDMALEMCDVREAVSLTVETEASPRLRATPLSRRDKSWTRLEKDILDDGNSNVWQSWRS